MHATLTYFEFVSVEYAVINVDFPIFVETFLLNGGLNLMIFLLCYYAFDGLCLWFYILVLYPDAANIYIRTRLFLRIIIIIIITITIIIV